ncbi:Os02g0824350, partial [Oryza sativa Japonica Group]
MRKNQTKQIYTENTAVRTPPTLPPITLWSGPHRAMQRPPLRVREPPSSITKYDPDRHRISNRPCQTNGKHK